MFRTFRSALLALALLAAGVAEPPLPTGQAVALPQGNPVSQPACALLKACGITLQGSACSIEQSRPLSGVNYDAQRCAEPLDLLAHGIPPQEGIGPLVYRFLGGRYRVVYDITGEAPISEARFNYLAQDLPLAARLATHFSKTKYVIQYRDATLRRFHAERAQKLTGDAEMLFHDIGQRRRTYYGWGNSKFGPWKLHGSAYVDVRIRPNPKNPKTIVYDVRIRTAPENAVVNAIMRLGLFKGLVVGQIEDTMKDLVAAAKALQGQGVEGTLKDPGFRPEDHEKIRALAALPD